MPKPDGGAINRKSGVGNSKIGNQKGFIAVLNDCFSLTRRRGDTVKNEA
jgi:hypothetical protein